MVKSSVTAMLFASCLMAACGGGNVSRGEALYAEGYYVEAAEVFERNEHRLNEWPADKRAEYALYRSMTLARLGDIDGAARWLHYCDWVEQRSPGSLSDSGLRIRAEAHAALSQARGARPEAPTAPASTIAAKSSPPGVEAAQVPTTRKSFSP